VIALLIQRGIAWWRKRSRDYSAVAAEATLESLQRLRGFWLIAVPLHGIFYWQFSHYQVPLGRPDLALWAQSIAAPHGVMLGVAVVVGLLTQWHLRQVQRSHVLGVCLQIGVVVAYLALGAALTLADLKVGAPAGIGSYLLISVVLSAMVLLRPGISVPVFFAVYGVFYDALVHLGLGSAQYTSLQLITLSVPVLSSVVSIMIWRQYVRATLLKRQLSASNAELLYLAQHDTLTGLYNRRYFTPQATAELARAARAQLPTSMLIADIDWFKKINDGFGHPIGDAVLQQVSQRLAASVRATDVVARLGGEEFVVLMPNTSRVGALALAEKLRASVERHALQIGRQAISVSVSVGVSEFPAGETGAFEDLYGAADKALYVAKHNGRNRVDFAEAPTHAPPNSRPPILV
jgi:diguanylate cyclase (GGDEF)-like protein